MAFQISRRGYLRGRPVRPPLAGGITASIFAHWASVRSVGYLFLSRRLTYTEPLDLFTASKAVSGCDSGGKILIPTDDQQFPGQGATVRACSAITD